jgi:hypothetical protein
MLGVSGNVSGGGGRETVSGGGGRETVNGWDRNWGWTGEAKGAVWCVIDRPLGQVGTRRKRCPGQSGQDGMGSIPATPSTKHASCFPPSSMPASIEISIKLIVCLSGV